MDVGRTYLLFVYRGVFSNRARSFAVDNCGRSQQLGSDTTKVLKMIEKAHEEGGG